MSQQHPELVFVTGPQAGQRVVLNRKVAVIGRGSGADILLSEDFASRKQAKYELLPDGPSLANLSERGTWINGNRFKVGKQVLLDTGDLLGFGRETQLLFVAAGDDVETALETCRKLESLGKNAFGRKLEVLAPARQPAPPPEPEGITRDLHQEAAKARQELARKPSEMTADERSRAQAKAKKRKLLIALGAYLGVIAALAIALRLYGRGGGGDKPPAPVLAQQQIADRLSLKVEGYTPMSIKEEKRLKDAHDLHERYSSTSTKLHEIVWAFKEALAYGGRTFFKNPADDRLYAAVLARWIEVVEQKYRQACILEKNKDWIQAEKEFNELLAVIGDDKNPVFANVKDHYSRVKWYREKKAPSKRRPWE